MNKSLIPIAMAAAKK